MASRAFDLAPGLRIRVEGATSAVAHFEAEYGRVAVDGSGDGAALVVRFGREPAPFAAAGRPDVPEAREDRHRWLRWSVVLSEPSMAGATAWIRVAGAPRGTLLSLVQGWVVEPLVSIVAPSTGHVLVPGAAIASPGGLVLLLGGSGAGKSSVSARALAAGATVLGDDQVLVDAAGLCRPFPRRIRVYPDLAATAPDAFATLPSAARTRLAAHRVLERLTAGRLRPSLPLPPSAFGAWRPPAPLPIARVLLVEPRVRCLAPQLDRVTPGDAVVTAEHLLRRQRDRFGWIAPARWHAVVEAVARQESAIVADAVRGAEVTRLRLPRDWSAARSVDALAAELGFAALAPTAAERLAVAGPADGLP